MKLANPAARNVAVSAKDRAVMMMGGHKIDAAYWWKGGAFTTFANLPLAASAQAQNRASAALIAKGAPAFAVPAWCLPTQRALAAGTATIGAGRFALDPAKPDGFRVSPRIDAATADLAVALASDMKLGKGAAPDVLSVSFSATDYIGQAPYPVSQPERIDPAADLSITKTNTPLLNIPQSVSVVTKEFIRDQSFQSVTDVTRYVPGVAIHQGEGNRDDFVFRGLESSANLYADGIRDDAQVFRDLYNLERVEVLKGSVGMIFGRGGAGGVVNRVTKLPLFDSVGAANFTLGSHNQARGTFVQVNGITQPAPAPRFSSP